MSKKSRHTPGPWYYDGPSLNTGAHIIHVAEGEIAEAFASWNSETEATANARLIAAAPELLDALESACDMLESVCDGQMREGYYWSQAQELRKIITKAKGNQEQDKETNTNAYSGVRRQRGLRA